MLCALWIYRSMKRTSKILNKTKQRCGKIRTVFYGSYKIRSLWDDPPHKHKDRISGRPF